MSIYNIVLNRIYYDDEPVYSGFYILKSQSRDVLENTLEQLKDDSISHWVQNDLNFKPQKEVNQPIEVEIETDLIGISLN